MRAEVAVVAGAAQQERLDAWLQRHPQGRRAVISESAFGPLVAPPDVPLVRLAGGCVCCIGVVPLRVAITRIVHLHRPDDLLLLIGSGDHVARVRSLLTDGGFVVAPAVEQPPPEGARDEPGAALRSSRGTRFGVE